MANGYVQDVGYVDFYGHPIVTTFSDEHGYLVPMKHVIEGHLGMEWKRQSKKLNATTLILDDTGEECEIHLYNPVNILGEDISRGLHLEHEFEDHIIPTFTPTSMYTCLPLDEFNYFLNSINISRVNLEVREILLTYQRECMTALHDYWMHGFAINDRKVSSQISSGRDDFNPRDNTTNALNRACERYSKFAFRNFDVEVSPEDIAGYTKNSIYEILCIDDEVWENMQGALTYQVAYMETTAFNVIHFAIEKGVAPDELPEVLTRNIEQRWEDMGQNILAIQSPYSAFPGIGRGAKRELV